MALKTKDQILMNKLLEALLVISSVMSEKPNKDPYYNVKSLVVRLKQDGPNGLYKDIDSTSTRIIDKLYKELLDAGY